MVQPSNNCKLFTHYVAAGNSVSDLKAMFEKKSPAPEFPLKKSVAQP